MSPYVKRQWHVIKSAIEHTDFAFAFLRVIILWGVAGWLIFSPVPRETTGYVTCLIIFFFIYSCFIYILLFFLPEEKRNIYKSSLIFDFLFTTLLVRVTGGFASPFSNGFYLMTALYSFYFGTVIGTVIAILALVLYCVSGNCDFTQMYWTDFSVRAAFLFLLAIPLGMLSQRLKKDKEEIEGLNKKLKRHFEEVGEAQKKLLE